MSSDKVSYDPPVQRGPWQVHGEETVFENPWLALKRYPITQPNTGEPGEYGVVHFKNIAVGVLPLDDEGYTYLIGQHRFAFDAYSWELPEGGGKLDVRPEETARRELEEETGLVPASLLPLGSWQTSNSVTDERAVAFIATGLTPGQTAPDPSEVLSLRRLKFSELLALVMQGEIADAFTVLMVQTALLKAQAGHLPDEISQLLLAED
ncbi:MAG: NUDIX hydrolase [Aquisalinus sp.]|nr:NUDIX hydrolase [Aquisalinus sp.]